MYLSRVCGYGLFVVAWLCCSSLLIDAQNLLTNPEEVKALQAIKSSLMDPYNNISNWDQGDPCTSNWTGVVCSNKTVGDGYLHVQKLHLLQMNLSGSLSPALGQLSNLTILDFMWNNISGIIPMEIGNITSLELLLLNGNQLTGPLPEELGYLPNLKRLQIDQNQISGSIPKSFANLNATQHFHMNNNSISGQIPSELSRLPNLLHFLLDNNNLSGNLPPEFSTMPNLRILQLDNNNFNGATIPSSYSNMSKLLKLSLRNCSLQGPVPNLSQIPNLYYLDLSLNQLNGTIPSDKLSGNMTTILLSNNSLTGTIPTSFSDLPRLQILSIANNSLSGSVPSSIWQNRTLNGTEKLTVQLQNNGLSNISGTINLSPNVTVWLQGNPLCSNSSLSQFCRFESDENNNQSSTNTTSVCPAQECPPPFEYLSSPASPVACLCAAPLFVGYRLKSPGFSDFRPYINTFEEYLSSSLDLFLYQLYIDSFFWEEGPRLGMNLKLFPVYGNSSTTKFNMSEVNRIFGLFTSWNIDDSDIFGPYELISFPLLGFYREENSNSSSGLSKGALVGIVLGTIAGAVALSAVVTLLILRAHIRKYHAVLGKRRFSKASIKIDGVKDFTFEEMVMATNNFDSSAQVGEGGYGKVYKGILADGTVVAIKRAQQGSLQGETEFLTEIELLSRLHHRNLVSLTGYCDEEGEQMLVYEFMPNLTLRDNLSAKSKEPMSFAMRLRIALESAKGILYLHTEANPPIFHRDIKASNILLDSRYIAKVADFGLSRLAPVPDVEGVVPAHVSTVVKGTPGYLDPEYFLTRKLTDKSDVYSLGVVFLELLTGMHPISHGKNIVREVNAKYQSGMIFSVIDEQMGSYPSECVMRFFTLALKCCKEETDARPSVLEMVRELEIIWNMMPDSDIKSADPMVTDAEKVVTPSTSSSTVKNTYVSFDVSGNDLVSGAVPSITPR
ncbi:probable LRR receptor-like serine/threonine-protein kinase At1g06840 [Quercus robur]|uniref:probable LRR receptor-like serine/threonine-protein kinase At1g06840 n=1 Tax=Quercus robur TaxID=38942 RepID=UPI00216393F0|nr:probable LRR receptor-like serine/threonine-protein kinase At1g06840 [Quercus robur]